MFFRQKDEEKRSKMWKLVMITSSVLIVVGIVFFITLNTRKNPLDGQWYSEANDYYLEVDDDGEATLSGTFQGMHLEIDLKYTISKKDKTISIKPEEDAYEDAIENSRDLIDGQHLDDILAGFMTSFDYSLDRDTLTLTEREYGEQYIFTRIYK